MNDGANPNTASSLVQTGRQVALHPREFFEGLSPEYEDDAPVRRRRMPRYAATRCNDPIPCPSLASRKDKTHA